MSFDPRDAEGKIRRFEQDLDDLRRELGEAMRRLDVVERRANRTYNFLWNRMQDED